MSGYSLKNPLPRWGRGSCFGRSDGDRAESHERVGRRDGSKRMPFGPMLILLFIALALAGCGKKGAPQPPPDEPNTYPRTYPNA